MTAALRVLHRFRLPLFYVSVLTTSGTVLLRRVLPDTPFDRVLIWLSLVGLVGMLVWLVAVTAGPRMRQERATMLVHSPVRGRWLAMNSPATAVPSHGVRGYGQAYAIDLVHEPESMHRPEFGAGGAMRRNEDYPAFGKPVHAMVCGVVVRASDWRIDHRSRSSRWALIYMMVEGMIRELGGPGWVVGNHVTIRADDGTYALVAHLGRGSAAVRRGDVVRAGDLLGRCGNSGNSSEPHVHAQLMDRQSLWTAEGVPMAFVDVRIGDSAEKTEGMPANEEHMTAAGGGL